MRREAALCVLVVSLAASPGKCQEGPRAPQDGAPQRAPVVGSVDLKEWVETRARLMHLEAELKRCEEARARRRNFLRAIVGRLFGRR